MNAMVEFCNLSAFNVAGNMLPKIKHFSFRSNMFPATLLPKCSGRFANLYLFDSWCNFDLSVVYNALTPRPSANS